jgi:hypothetical protein
MVASRNEERLKQAAEEMKKNINSDSLAEIDHVQCNIRKEEQVIITWKLKFYQIYVIIYLLYKM